MGGGTGIGGENYSFEHVRTPDLELSDIVLAHAEHIPDSLRFKDLDEYADKYLEIIESDYPYLLEDEFHSYKFTDANGMGEHHMVHVRYDNVRYDQVRVALQAVPPMRGEDIPRHNAAFRQLQASIEALEQVSLVESTTSQKDSKTERTFNYQPGHHEQFMGLIDVVFENPDIMPSSATSAQRRE